MNGEQNRLLALVGTFFWASGVLFVTSAADLTVTTLDDELDPIASSGSGISLREAIRETNSGDRIDFDPSLANGTLTLTMGELALTKSLTIDFDLTEGIFTIDAADQSRVISTAIGTTSTLRNLRLIHGSAAEVPGGAVHNGGDLTIENCEIRKSSAAFGGGIYSSGVLTIKDSSISGNQTGAEGNGGGIYAAAGNLSISNSEISRNSTGNGQTLAGGFGGGIYNESATVHLEGSLITGNRTGDGGVSTRLEDDVLFYTGAAGGSGGGLCQMNGTATVIECEITENRTGSGGGSSTFFQGFAGSGGAGAGVSALGGNLSLSACTIAFNHCGRGGSLYNSGYGGAGGGISNQSDNCSIVNCTIVSNLSGEPGNGFEYDGDSGLGGGIANYGDMTVNSSTIARNEIAPGEILFGFGGGGIYSKGALTLTNSIVVENIQRENSQYPEMHQSVSVPDLFQDATLSVQGFNILSTLEGSGILSSPNIILGDPLLTPLGNYGGSTRTMLPLPPSPAINQADPSLSLILDQRGLSRDAMPDIGAVEFASNADLSLIWDLDWDNDGLGFGIESAFGTDPETPDAGSELNLRISLDSLKRPVLTFGFNPDVQNHTAWILKRTTDLQPNAVEIYRWESPSTAPLNLFQVIDTAPVAGRAFYFVEAILKQ